MRLQRHRLHQEPLRKQIPNLTADRINDDEAAFNRPLEQLHKSAKQSRRRVDHTLYNMAAAPLSLRTSPSVWQVLCFLSGGDIIYLLLSWKCLGKRKRDGKEKGGRLMGWDVARGLRCAAFPY